jgi:hypothetical protein
MNFVSRVVVELTRVVKMITRVVLELNRIVNFVRQLVNLVNWFNISLSSRSFRYHSARGATLAFKQTHQPMNFLLVN